MPVRLEGTVTADELVAELLKLDRAVVVQSLQSSAQPIFQSVFDKGHAAATAKFTSEKAGLDGRVTALEASLKEKDDQIKVLGEKAPEIATLQQQHTDAVNKLKRQHQDELKVANDTLIGERRSVTKSALRVKLINAGVDAEYADVLVSKPEFEQRLKPNQNGVIEILRADSDAPYAPAKDKDALDLVVEELLPKVPAKFKSTQTDRGSGVTGAGGAGAKGATRYDAERKAGEERAKSVERGPSAKERLSGAK